jgi:hypothetical protein
MWPHNSAGTQAYGIAPFVARYIMQLHVVIMIMQMSEAAVTAMTYTPTDELFDALPDHMKVLSFATSRPVVAAPATPVTETAAAAPASAAAASKTTATASEATFADTAKAAAAAAALNEATAASSDADVSSAVAASLDTTATAAAVEAAVVETASSPDKKHNKSSSNSTDVAPRSPERVTRPPRSFSPVRRLYSAVVKQHLLQEKATAAEQSAQQQQQSEAAAVAAAAAAAVPTLAVQVGRARYTVVRYA